MYSGLIVRGFRVFMEVSIGSSLQTKKQPEIKCLMAGYQLKYLLTSGIATKNLLKVTH